MKERLLKLIRKHIDDVMIEAYNGYGNGNQIYCYGRIREDEKIDIKEGNLFNTLLNSYKRIESDELCHLKFRASFHHFQQDLQTNGEGYFKIDQSITGFETTSREESISFAIKGSDLPMQYKQKDIATKGRIFFPSKEARFGVISDIDDTILKTDVLVYKKLKSLYHTAFTKAVKRQTIKGTDKWYQQLHNGHNPLFYVSNSPWNIYEYLQLFLSHNKYPEGVVLLRDFGKAPKDALQDYKNHKRNETERILQMYPDLPFVLIGDGGEKDADIYLSMKQKYGEQIKAIFIHRLGSKKHQSRIEKLMKGHEDYFFFIESGDEGMRISQQQGLMDS